MPDVPERVIYCDGGSNDDQRSAAAISVHHGIDPAPCERHALYVERSTNNICEFAALIAAMRYIERAQPKKKTLVIVDSEIAFKCAVGGARCTNKLAPLYREINTLYNSLKTRNLILLAHMYRTFTNKADALVQDAKKTRRRSCGCSAPTGW
jgi:ribonuclease HI